MGNADTKLHFRKAVVQLTTKTQPIDASDDSFWEQFWGEHVTSVQDVFALIPAAEIRSLREEAPSNLATLCYKAVEKLVRAADTGCSTQQEQQIVLNSMRILTRVIPYIFEDPDWRGFFWSSLPAGGEEEGEGESIPLAHSLIHALCDLLFCPDFTVTTNKKSGPDKHEDLQSIDSCEFIWEAGVGFAHSPSHVPAHDTNRTEILKLILTCFSQSIYQPSSDATDAPNRWIAVFTSADNRHALPLFTSLLNIVCGYNPIGFGVPYNHLLFSDSREPLVEVALQILITTLDHDITAALSELEESAVPDNLFINYLSRIHREEDFSFVLRGFTRLLNNPLQQTYLPHSTKKVNFHQELLVFFWKFCDYNKKFLFYVLKSSDVLDILVPILYHLNDARADQSRVGLMHIGVFILLLLSGERNFGVRLNKPYTASVPMDIPVFTGTHADLMIIVFHKIITTGHQRLQPLFDCLLTILVNVSPYIKTMSMVASNKLLHLLEAFSTPWFLFSAPHHHHLVFFLLETFNNIIQYQFDGNSNLVYTIIRKRQVFHSLANLPTDYGTINKSLNRRGKRGLLRQPSTESTRNPNTMEGAVPAQPAQPGTKTATLAAMPGLEKMTEKESAHPTTQQLNELTTAASVNGDLVGPISSTSLASPQMVGEDDFTAAGDMAPPIPQGTGIQPPTESHTLPAVEDIKISEKPSRPESPTLSLKSAQSDSSGPSTLSITHSESAASALCGSLQHWMPNSAWVLSWKTKLPLQTIMRLLQVLVPQVEKICIDKGLTDESEILRFLQHGTLVGLLPVPHPILIRKYQANAGTATWFRTYMWGIIYLRNVDPPIWYDTDVKLFEIQRV
ncbi:protein HID1 isoform X2 [Panulirus ornatus]|uniref:protein HID1 isoform X2 n=1 Tax=Panulirus ornatus TaxID=150431 RepID=UPI003A87951D